MKDEPFLTHLHAFRKALIRAALALLIGIIACAAFAPKLFEILSRPLARALPKDSHFIATSPTEAWLVYFKVALLSGFFLASPVIFAQIWGFISPGLYQHEKRRGLVVVFASSLFFIGGALFGYFVAFPYAFEYFVSIVGDTSIQFLPSMQSYFGIASQLLLAFGIIFELPIVLFFLVIWDLVSIRDLSAFRRYFILVAFIIAAIMTPPDAISQLMMALPLLMLYEVGIWSAWIYQKVNGKGKRAKTSSGE